MDKREIEKALLGLVGIADNAPLILHGYLSELVDALAKQIAIECEVEHIKTIPGETITRVKIGMIIGKHGTPRKALAIIIPLEEEGEI